MRNRLRRDRLFLPIALWLLLALAAATAAAQSLAEFEKTVTQFKLANGMQFIVVERREVPIVAFHLYMDVGGADENVGQTGVAHLFEHLAFKGTSVVGTRDWAKEQEVLAQLVRVGDALVGAEAREKPDAVAVAALREELAALTKRHAELVVDDAFTDLLAREGASGLNATTDKDVTSYFVSLPANRLERWALLESSRLAAPVLRGFYTERDVVMEERRMRVDSEPGGALYEELNAVAFSLSPYRWTTLGTMNDLRRLTVADAMAFFRRHYVPASAVGALVGDFEVETAKRVVERTFGEIPAREATQGALPLDPEPRADRRTVLTFDAHPRLFVAFPKPTLPHADDYVFDVIQTLLAQGRSARLYRALVTDKRLAVSVGASTGPGARLPNLFVVSAMTQGPHTIAEVESAIDAELDRLRREPVSDAELHRVRTQLAADLARQIATNAGLAATLSYFEAVAGDWRYAADHARRIEAVTAADVMRVARQYFAPGRRVTALIEPSRPEVRQ